MPRNNCPRPQLPSLCENESPSRFVDYDLGFVSRVHGRFRCERCVANASAGLPCWCVIGTVGRAKLCTLLCRTSPVQWSPWRSIWQKEDLRAGRGVFRGLFSWLCRCELSIVPDRMAVPARNRSLASHSAIARDLVGGLFCRGSCRSHRHLVGVDQHLPSPGSSGRRVVDPVSQLALGICNQPTSCHLDLLSPAEASRERVRFQPRKFKQAC